MINEVQEILINESEIQEKVKYLAEQINKDYAGKDIVLMIILKGSVVFSADLMRYLNVNVSLDFMQVSSYGSSSVSGELKILKDGQIDVNGKNVIIAEDIIDSGNTLSALVKLLKREVQTLKSVHFFQSLQDVKRRLTLNTKVLKFLTNLLSATVWTMTKDSEICHTSVY